MQITLQKSIPLNNALCYSGPGVCACVWSPKTVKPGQPHSLVYTWRDYNCLFAQFCKSRALYFISVLTFVWVSHGFCVGVCYSDEGAEHMSGAAAGERGGNIGAES